MAQQPATMREINMTDNQNEQKNLQHENLHEEDKKAISFTGKFWLIFFSLTFIAGVIFALFTGAHMPVFTASVIAVIPILFIIGVGIFSLLLACMARFCFGLFSARELAGGTMRWVVYIFRCFIFMLAALVVFMFISILFNMWLNPPGDRVEARNIVINLRSLQSASVMLRADKGELIHELPKGVNLINYLTRYTFNPEAPVWSEYMFIIADNDYWWVGGLYVGSSRRGRLVRRVLENRSDIGLFGTSQPEPPLSAYMAYQYQTNDAFVWLLIRTPAVDDVNGGD